MDFSVQISVPIEEDAEGRLEDIVKHMPDGTTFYMVEI